MSCHFHFMHIKTPTGYAWRDLTLVWNFMYILINESQLENDNIDRLRIKIEIISNII